MQSVSWSGLKVSWGWISWARSVLNFPPTCSVSWADLCLVFPGAKERSHRTLWGWWLISLQFGYFNVVWSFTALGVFFSEMRSCLHPACAGGQPRCLGTVITQKVINRARIETCTPHGHCQAIPPPITCCPSKGKGFWRESLCLLKMASWWFEPFLAPTHRIRTGFLLSLKMTNVVFHIKSIYSACMREEEGWTSP